MTRTRWAVVIVAAVAFCALAAVGLHQERRDCESRGGQWRKAGRTGFMGNTPIWRCEER